MVDSSRVSEALVKALPRLDDESLVEYLTAVVCDTEDYGTEGELLVEAVAPFIESYGCVDSSDEAEAAVRAIYRDLVQQAVLPSAEQQRQVDEAGVVADMEKLQAGAGVSAEDRDEIEDDWGLADVKVKNKANVVVDSIMSAQDKRRQQRKAAREQRKEDSKQRAVLAEEAAAKEAERQDRIEAQALGQAASTAALTGTVLSGPRSRDVRIEGYSLSIGSGKQLLENADLKIRHGAKYGLIGLNGVGKTSLLREISHRRVEGFPVNLDVLHVEQEVTGDDTTVLQYVLSCDAKREMLLREEERLMAELNANEAAVEAAGQATAATDEQGKKIAESLARLYETMSQHGTDGAEANARRILTGLSFSAERQVATTKSLSGGWRMRVAIASALFVEPDILMLDEPTNHLDLEACVWLERYLQSYKKTLMLVSHDR
jgi:ATP-binding cassette subfamily F protein 3